MTPSRTIVCPVQVRPQIVSRKNPAPQLRTKVPQRIIGLQMLRKQGANVSAVSPASVAPPRSSMSFTSSSRSIRKIDYSADCCQSDQFAYRPLIVRFCPSVSLRNFDGNLFRLLLAYQAFLLLLWGRARKWLGQAPMSGGFLQALGKGMTRPAQTTCARTGFRSARAPDPVLDGSGGTPTTSLFSFSGEGSSRTGAEMPGSANHAAALREGGRIEPGGRSRAR